MAATYIDDGYTRDDGYIAAAQPAKSGEQLWGSLSFTYRTATRAEVIRHDAEIRIALNDEHNDPSCAVKAEELAAKFVADRVVSWDLKNRGNHTIPVSVDACLRINSHVFSRLYRIIRGSELSDPRPPETDVPASDEALQKNSPVG